MLEFREAAALLQAPQPPAAQFADRPHQLVGNAGFEPATAAPASTGAPSPWETKQGACSFGDGGQVPGAAGVEVTGSGAWFQISCSGSVEAGSASVDLRGEQRARRWRRANKGSGGVLSPPRTDLTPVPPDSGHLGPPTPPPQPAASPRRWAAQPGLPEPNVPGPQKFSAAPELAAAALPPPLSSDPRPQARAAPWNNSRKGSPPFGPGQKPPPSKNSCILFLPAASAGRHKAR